MRKTETKTETYEVTTISCDYCGEPITSDQIPAPINDHPEADLHVVCEYKIVQDWYENIFLKGKHNV